MKFFSLALFLVCASLGAESKFLRGANFGNYLETSPDANWRLVHTREDLARVRAEGFDHVRIPVKWSAYSGAGPGFLIEEAFARKVDEMVEGALTEGLGVIVNIHHFDEFTTDPAAHTEKFYKLWEQVARRYATKSDLVAFELLNEPMDAATTVVMNPVYAEAIKRIRATNPKRTIFVGPGKWNQASELKNLRLPKEDRNLVVTIHSYEPFLFTHQGASWSGKQTATVGLVFPGPPAKPLLPASAAAEVSWTGDWFKRYSTLSGEKNPSSRSAFIQNLEIAKKWSEENGRPIHVGEFGCYEKADALSRANYYRAMREECEKRGFGWAIWDWKAGFKYWDSKSNRPADGMREALFGKK